jgi:hypothetical protein
MAIVQISKIQHRRGLKENLPNLSSAELGWALDTRQLYIGNGTLTEGAPTTGRTQILTEYSDILGLFASYTYSGADATGVAVQTGPSAASPVERSIRARLDEFVSVKSFGATGDGVTDDTAAINRAFYQLYCEETIESIRRTIHFPAGVYVITDVIKIPTYATVIGDGKDSTIIKQTDPAGSLVFSLADSLQQVEANIGNNSATRPSFISISNITFSNDVVTGSVGLISDAASCVFENVKFSGPAVDPTEPGNGTYGVFIESTPVLQTNNIRFVGCDFYGLSYAVVADDDMQNVTWDGCVFSQLYRGFKIGENTTGSGASVEGPIGIRVINSYFNEIANTAIYGYTDITGIYSAFNRYGEVGNAYAGASNPVAPIIVFTADGNHSVGDSFERNDTDNISYPRVSSGDFSVYAQYVNEIHMGSLRQQFGKTIILADNTSTPTPTGIEFNTSRMPTAMMDYSMLRDGLDRQGTLKLAHTNSGRTLDDEFIEATTDVGVTFSLTNDGSSTTTVLAFTSTNTGADITFKYAIRQVK